jgi:hypothetical protein
MEEVVLVLRTVELTTEVIEGVRTSCTSGGIEPMSHPSVDERARRHRANPVAPTTPSASVEAELHERATRRTPPRLREDGPELGAPSPGPLGRGRRGGLLRVAQSPIEWGSSDPVRM